MTNCKARVLSARYSPLTRNAAKAKPTSDDRGGRAAEDDGDLPGNAGSGGMDRRIGADSHHRGVAEVELSGPSENEVEAECAGGPYQPREQVAAEIERIDQQRCGKAERKQDADHPAVGRNRKQRAVGGIVRMKNACLPEQHGFRSSRCRGGRYRPCGRSMMVRISIAASTRSRLAPPSRGSRKPAATPSTTPSRMPASNAPPMTVQAAENGDGHALQQQLRQRLVDALHRRPKHACDGRHHRRHRPRERDAALDGDADRPRRGVVVGDRAQHDAASGCGRTATKRPNISDARPRRRPRRSRLIEHRAEEQRIVADAECASAGRCRPRSSSTPARRKMSRPSVIIRIMTIGRPASRRSATRSMAMPTPNIVTIASGIASQIGAPALLAKASTT